MWNEHTIRGPPTERGRGGGVPNVLFQHEQHFDEDDALVAEIGADMFAAEPGLQLHERREVDATPPPSQDPLHMEEQPGLSHWLQRVRSAAMAMADQHFGFCRTDNLDAAVLQFNFFLHVTLELRRLVDGLPIGAHEWAASAHGSEFSHLFKVRNLIVANAQRAWPWIRTDVNV